MSVNVMADDDDAEPVLSPHQITRVLSDALPFMQRYYGKTVVVKYGGHAMVNEKLARQFASDMVQLKLSGINPIVVHGGGPQIGAMLKRLNIKSSFKNGLRVTCDKTIEVVEMVLSGSINKQVVTNIQRAGGKGIGISGKDGNLCVAKKLQRTTKDPESKIETDLELGFVGEPAAIHPEILETILASEAIPVIAPVAISREGDTYNINADTFAGAIAEAVKAKRLMLLTDVPGVLDKNGDLISELSLNDVEPLIQDGTITEGMIPKIQSCASVVRGGVEGVIILDGRQSHAVLLELFTPHGIGTRIS
jgi:acetylglutamate kinase